MDFRKTPGNILMPDTRLQIGGVFSIEHVRDGEVIDAWDEHNLVTNEGLNHLLDVHFHGTSQIATWYIGVFEANYTPLASDTAATFPGSATECTAYDETTRVAFDEAAASGQSITNSASKATFTFNATKTIYGAFLASASGKSATTGKLFSASKFGAGKAVVDDDQLLITYTIGASG